MHDEHYLQVYARLKPGATDEQALGELRANAQRLRGAFPREAAELDFTTISALDDLVGDYPRRMFTLLGAVGFVLLIACGNVANLLLARGAARAGELAVRAALGAGRARIARQLLTESVVLALISAVVGIGLAAWGIRALVAAAPAGVPRLEQTTLDPYVLLFTLMVTLVSAMLFGVAPALRAARVDVQTVIKAGGRGAGMGGIRDRLRTGLIVGGAGRRAAAARRRGPPDSKLARACRASTPDSIPRVFSRRASRCPRRRIPIAPASSRRCTGWLKRRRKCRVRGRPPSRRTCRWAAAATATASSRKASRSTAATPSAAGCAWSRPAISRRCGFPSSRAGRSPSPTAMARSR